MVSDITRRLMRKLRMRSGWRPRARSGVKTAFVATGAIALGAALLTPSGPPHAKPPKPVAAVTSVPFFKHVFVLYLENHSYADVVYEHDMSYLHHLLNTYGAPTQFYGITNPTVPNRVGILCGCGRTIGDNVHRGQLSNRNLVDQLSAHHLTWDAFYQHTETSTHQHPVYDYSQSTFELFKDVYDSPSRLAHLKPLRDLQTALTDNTVPNFTWIGPNFITNSHGAGAPGPYQYTYQGAGPGGEGTHDARLEELSDRFLETWIPRILSSAAWHSGPSAIFLTYDETSYDASMPQIGNWASNLAAPGSPDYQAGTFPKGVGNSLPFPGGVNGGGHIAAALITNTAGHVVSAEPFNQFSILKTIETGWHLSYLGEAANPKVDTMGVFFHPSSRPAPPVAGRAALKERLTPSSAAAWSSTPPSPALPPAEVSSTDVTTRPLADPHFSLGASGQAASGLEIYAYSDPSAVTHSLTLTLGSGSGLTFAGRSSPVGSTAVANADEDATQFGPASVSKDVVSFPIATTGKVPERLFLTGLMVDVASSAATGPVTATLASSGVSFGKVVLGTVGRPSVRSAPNLLAPVVSPGSVEVRFVPPACSGPVPPKGSKTCKGSSGARYEVEIESRNPATAVGSDLGLEFTATTTADAVTVTNADAELTALAGKQYWVRVRVTGGPGGPGGAGGWGIPLPFTALPGPLPKGVS